MLRPINEQELVAHLRELDEKAAIQEVRKRLESGAEPLKIVATCQEGMRQVGEKYAHGKYFVSGLIMAGEILRQVMELVQPLLQSRTIEQTSGLIILGTVSGDIHDIGKDLVKLLLRCHGFLVEDLGVDVAPADFLARSLEKNPDVVAMSGLLTITQESMRETVELLRRGWPSERPRITTVIGGGFIDDKVLNYVGADYWAADAMAGVKICQQVVGRRG